MLSSPLSTPQQSERIGFFRNPGIFFVFMRLCIYLILAEAVTYVVRPPLLYWIGRDFSQTSPRVVFLAEFLAMLGAFLAAFLLSVLEGRNFGEYGLPLRRDSAKHFLQGAVFGVAEISAVLGALAALGYYHFGALELQGGAILKWALIWGIIFLIVGLYEEFAFRGYAQFALQQGIGFWPAAVALSCWFGLKHWSNPGETPAGIVGVILSGLFWCFTLRRTGSLWFAVGMHASFDFGETFLYSVPDSGQIFPGHLSSATVAGPNWLTGGSAGPEASIFDFLVIAAFFVIFHRFYPQAASPAPQPVAHLGETNPSVNQV
jgi:membrane protease YdiL (CAAX protease family)